MSRNPHNLQVGQKLWFVFYQKRRGDAREVTVTKVGTKFAEIEGPGIRPGTRVYLDTMRVDGGSHASPARCHLSREDYEAMVELETAWRELGRVVSGPRPEGTTAQILQQVRALLGA